MKFKYKIYILLTILLGTFLALCFFVILPLVKEISLESKALEQEKNRLASARALVESFEDFEKNYQLYAQGLDQMNFLLTEEIFIDPELPINFINFFKEQADELDLSLKILPSPIKKDEKNDEEKWQETGFRIEWVGNYLNTMRFIDKLENSRWLIEIISINMAKHSPKGEEQALQEEATIQTSVFIRVYAKK